MRWDELADAEGMWKGNWEYLFVNKVDLMVSLIAQLGALTAPGSRNLARYGKFSKSHCCSCAAKIPMEESVYGLLDEEKGYKKTSVKWTFR